MKRAERLELRLYRGLLQYYPEKFQRKYGAEMLRTFRDTLQDATLGGRLPSFWWESLVDSVVSIRRERRAARITPLIGDRYTQDTRFAFRYAREEHRALAHGHLVSTEHVLLGVLRDPKVYKSLLEFGCTLEAIRAQIKALQGVNAAPWSGTDAKLGTETQHLIALAVRLARANNDQLVEPSHLLLAILEQPSSLAFQVLTSFATSEQIRSAIGTSTG